MTEVFISYKRENLAVVNRLVEALRTEGVSVWWDQDIPPNAAWEATIERALTEARLVVVAWSPASVASENVKAEARWARAQGRLLQVFVEACDPPLFFGERQGVDLKAWSGVASEPGFRAVLEAIKTGLQGSPGPTAQSGDTADAPLALPTKPSIAVLPFANISGDPEQEYFADGMVVEITNVLSRFQSIFVIASGSSLSFKGKDVSPQEAARQLGVRYVLEGSVRKAGNRVRIAVQLVDATDSKQIWTHRFDDTLDDVFDLQDKVALSVGAIIEPAVHAAELKRSSGRSTESLGAYDLYLRGRSFMGEFTGTGALQAISAFERAIALDPGYGLALGAAAVCQWLILVFAWSADPESHRRSAIELAHRALKVADDAETLSYAALVIGGLEQDAETARALIDRAIVLNPGSAVVWLTSGQLFAVCGEADRAVEHIETAMRLDPAGPNRTVQLCWMGVARFRQERYAEAMACEREVAQHSEWPLVQAILAASCGHLGRPAEAKAAITRFRAQTDRPIESVGREATSDPVFDTLYLEGIALAEGRSPADGSASNRA